MYEYAEAAVDGAIAAGATYADARVVVSRTQSIDVRNEVVESVDNTEARNGGAAARL